MFPILSINKLGSRALNIERFIFKTFHISIIVGFGETMFSMIDKCRQFPFSANQTLEQD